MVISFCRKYCEREFARVGACTLTIDTSVPGYRGPKVHGALGKDGTIMLCIGPGIGITDLVLQDDGWGGTLKFGGQQVWCQAPWSAVVRMDRCKPPPKGGTPSAVRVANTNDFARAA